MQCNMTEKHKYIDERIALVKAQLFDIGVQKLQLENDLHSLYGAKETLDVLTKELSNTANSE